MWSLLVRCDRFLDLPYPGSSSVCRETLDLETMRFALLDMVQRAADDADEYCKVEEGKGGGGMFEGAGFRRIMMLIRSWWCW